MNYYQQHIPHVYNILTFEWGQKVNRTYGAILLPVPQYYCRTTAVLEHL